MCNHDGLCISEALRDMVKRYLEAHDDYIHSEISSKTESKSVDKPASQVKVTRISYDGKIWIDV